MVECVSFTTLPQEAKPRRRTIDQVSVRREDICTASLFDSSVARSGIESKSAVSRDG